MNELIFSKLDRLSYIGVAEDAELNSLQLLFNDANPSEQLSADAVAILYHDAAAAVAVLNLIFADIGIVFDNEVLRKMAVLSFEYGENISLRVSNRTPATEFSESKTFEEIITIKNVKETFSILEDYQNQFSKNSSRPKITLTVPTELLQSGTIVLFPALNAGWSNYTVARLAECAAVCCLVSNTNNSLKKFRKFFPKELWSRGIDDVSVIVALRTTETESNEGIIRSQLTAMATANNMFADKLLSVPVIYCSAANEAITTDWQAQLRRYISTKRQISAAYRKSCAFSAYLRLLSKIEQRAQIAADEVDCEILAIEGYYVQQSQRKIEFVEHNDDSTLILVRAEIALAVAVIAELFALQSQPPEKKITETVTKERFVPREFMGITVGKKKVVENCTVNIVTTSRYEIERQIKLLFAVLNKILLMLRKGALATQLLNEQQFARIEINATIDFPKLEEFLQLLHLDFGGQVEIRDEQAAQYRITYRRFMKKILKDVKSFFAVLENQVVKEYLERDTQKNISLGEQALKRKLTQLQERCNNYYEALEIIARLKTEEFM
ncbi:MAG: hypothetical protein WCP79_10900 [Bacillota bacterium]